jgi:putative acetyltransferase
VDLQTAMLCSYRNEFREQMVSLWERSVRATHDFVTEPDIRYFKELVNEINFNSFSVYCLVTQEQKVIGFIGLFGKSIETLFLDPDYIGLGFGKKLMEFAVEKLGANEVEVNEQNTRAVQFYGSFSFVVYDRLETDSNGKPYPVLKMRRN